MMRLTARHWILSSHKTWLLFLKPTYVTEFPGSLDHSLWKNDSLNWLELFDLAVQKIINRTSDHIVF